MKLRYTKIFLILSSTLSFAAYGAVSKAEKIQINSKTINVEISQPYAQYINSIIFDYQNAQPEHIRLPEKSVVSGNATAKLPNFLPQNQGTSTPFTLTLANYHISCHYSIDSQGVISKGVTKTIADNSVCNSMPTFDSATETLVIPDYSAQNPLPTVENGVWVSFPMTGKDPNVTPFYKKGALTVNYDHDLYNIDLPDQRFAAKDAGDKYPIHYIFPDFLPTELNTPKEFSITLNDYLSPIKCSYMITKLDEYKYKIDSDLSENPVCQSLTSAQYVYIKGGIFNKMTDTLSMPAFSAHQVE